MNVSEIQKNVDRLQKALVAKGKTRAEVAFQIESFAECLVMLQWAKPGSLNGYGQDYEFIRDSDPVKLFAKADAFIAKLPTAEETKFREFMGALGDVIELGRTNGIDVDFINPLTETMKRLSKNALTDQRVAANA